MAPALNLSQEHVFDETIRRAGNHGAVSHCTRPMSGIIFEGAAVDLGNLAICTNNPDDGGEYITAGDVIIKNPEYGNNLAIYRMMVVSNRGHDPLP